ncbi:MAG: metallophosphoesterase family protein, partial [Gemmatimonadota bacterium]
MRRLAELRALCVGGLAAGGLLLLGAGTAPASDHPAIARTTLPPEGVGRSTAVQADSSASFSFVVLGHLRGLRDGSLAYNLAELLDEVRELKPDFAVLTGDLIWGDTQTNPADSLRVVSEWNALDSALATLHTPIYRVPGNHDINDLVTRDIFFDRYGSIPRAVDVHGSRLILLGSGWIPADGDRRKHL